MDPDDGTVPCHMTDYHMVWRSSHILIASIAKRVREAYRKQEEGLHLEEWVAIAEDAELTGVWNVNNAVRHMTCGEAVKGKAYTLAGWVDVMKNHVCKSQENTSD